MPRTDEVPFPSPVTETVAEASHGLSRRNFLGGIGAAAAMATGAAGLAPLAAEASTAEAAASPRVLRRNHAWQIRMKAADYHKHQSMPHHLTNGDEARYPNRIGNYSKGLPHDSFGEVEPATSGAATTRSSAASPSPSSTGRR